MALALLTALPTLAQDWAVEGADARIRLSVEGDLYAREAPEMTVDLDLNALLGYGRTLKADSLVLVETQTGRRVELQLAEDAELRHASGNPVVRLTWLDEPQERFEDRSWDLYLATVAPGSEHAWQPLERTFSEGRPGVLWETSFEEPDPAKPDVPVGTIAGGWDKEGETTDRSWTDEAARTGERCLKVERRFDGEPPANTNRPHWRSQPTQMSVRPGQTVHVSAWLKSPEFGERSSSGMVLEFYGPENQRLSENRTRLRGQQIPHDWLEVEATAIVPDGAAYAALWFSLHGSGLTYCDDLFVTVAPAAQLPELAVEVGPVLARADVVAEQAPRSDERVLRCAVADAPPTIDGVLDDACWAQAGSVSDFIPFLQMPGTEVTTTVRACADREALYFGFECTEPDTSELLAAATERDGPAWQDDSVELFLDTNRDRQTFYQIIVNPKGVFFDQDAGSKHLAGPKWDGPITVATQILPDRWVAEVKLAFAGLRLAEAEGQVWGANFARTSYRGGRSAYTWARVESGFLEPENFGHVVLPFDPTANSVTGRPLAGDTIYRGEGALPFEVTNRRDRPVDVTVRVTREDDGAASEAQARLEAGATVQVAVPMSFGATGDVRLRYDLLARPEGTVLYTTAVGCTVPEALEVQPDHLLSYTDEAALTGRWQVGLAEGALAQTRIALQVRDAAGNAIASESVTPTASSGAYAVRVADAGAGRYTLLVRLEQGGVALAEREIVVDRMGGPFDGDGR